MGNRDISGFIDTFKGQSLITKDEIHRYYLKWEPRLKDSTLRWRIYKLKEDKLLLPVKRGVYSLNKKPIFKPIISKKLQRLESLYSADFSPSLTCIIWSTEWVHQFMVQQPGTHQIIIETEKSSIDSLFYHVQENSKNTYLNPSKDVIRDYVLRQKEAIIIKPIISRSPTQSVNSEIEIASLEKILIDLFCDQDLFLSYQGSELENIFANAWKMYSINLSALMNYAKRRKRADTFLQYVKKKNSLQELNKALHHDR
jgi:hypothetical protein